MYEQVEKPKENSFPTNRQESRAVANAVVQEKSGVKQGFGFMDNRPETAKLKAVQIKNSLSKSPLQLRTLSKAGNVAYTLPIAEDTTHWIVDSPLTGIKDRIGRTEGKEYDDKVAQKNKLKVGAKKDNTNTPYRAKHYGDSTAGGISGTVCHVKRNDNPTGYKITIPHYHACTKAGALSFAEAAGTAAVAGANDGMHLHASEDVADAQNSLNALSPATLNGAGETVADHFPGGWSN
ncbi:MAG: hypothetical protein WCU80_01190 [Paludibacteraceae bacterium]